jgi:hypothetical protein
MTGTLRRAALLLTLCLATLFGAGRVAAETPVPQPSRGQGERCVEDVDVMRREHMHMLKHQRDETMHKGVRAPQHSLKGCIACHAVAGGDGMPVSYSDPKHFCRTCHTYAAVAPDCFECHASRPPMTPRAADAGGDAATLNAFLRETKR